MDEATVDTSNARFIVGTGRCGSTILSRMIDQHPKVAVLSELFVSLDFHRKFGERPLGGSELVDILHCGLASTGEFKKIAAHLATPEIGFDADAAPIDPSQYRDGVLPDLILLPLPHLFEDPPAVFEELLQFAGEQPVRPLSSQYLVLFDWITRRAGKAVWIERSGGTIAHLPELIELFPDAKFLHLHRNPFDAAMSMQAHNHFRLRAFKHYGLKTADAIAWSDLDEGDLNSDPPMSPRLESIFEHPVPLEHFLRDWSDSILRGMKAVKNLSPRQYSEITFEQLMSDPGTALNTIADFFELPPGGDWIHSARSLLSPGQAAHAEPTEEQAALLERHCHAAMVLLERAPAMELYN